jgi:hypothetical protein
MGDLGDENGHANGVGIVMQLPTCLESFRNGLAERLLEGLGCEGETV